MGAYLGVQTEVWIGIGASVVVLLIVLLMALSRSRKAKPSLRSTVPVGEKSRDAIKLDEDQRSKSPQPQQVFAVDFSKDTLESWQALKGEQPAGKIVDGWYRLEAGQGSRTIDTMPASPNSRYRVDWRIKLASAATNGHRNNYSIGLLFMSEDNAILQWWQLQAPLETEGDVVVGSMDSVAPAGSVKMAFGIQGNLQPASDGIIALGSAIVTAVNDLAATS